MLQYNVTMDGAAPETPLEAPKLAVASRLAAPLPSSRLSFTALAAALAAHAALFCVLAAYGSDDGLAGGGGQHLDAISVTIVNSEVLESREPAAAQPPATAAAARLEMDEGSIESPPARPEQQKAAEKQNADPVDAATQVLPLEKQQQDHQETNTPASAGGATMRGDAAEAPAQTAPAAASPGAAREYARYVSQALAKNRPRGAGAHGTVRIRLVISPGGGLSSVQVARSSGNTRLDEIAVAAVEHAVLPVPPAGMTLAQLTYEVPYHFR